LGLVPPSRFIPIAEETGLITTIGLWVLNEACREARSWQEQGLTGLRVAVNLSARQFQQARLADQISEVLAATGLDAHLLELEITETAVMQDANAAAAILRSLNSLGVRVSLD